jgi:hypothetical protein
LGVLYGALGEKAKAADELKAAGQLATDDDGELKKKISAALQ